MRQAGSYNAHYGGAGGVGGYYSSNESSYPNPYYVAQDPFANGGYQTNRLSTHSSVAPGVAGLGARYEGYGPGQGYTQGGVPYEPDRSHEMGAYGGMDEEGPARDPQ
jgi:hypothetical protein